jgi:hypothetical protein
MESAMVPSQSNRKALKEPGGNFSLLYADDFDFVSSGIRL